MRFILLLAATAALAISQAQAASGPGGFSVSHHEGLQDFAFSHAGTLERPALSAAGPATMAFSALGRRFELQLESNERLLSENARGMLDSGVRLYKGRIAGNENSWVRIVMYDGVPGGLIWNGTELLAIEAPGDSSVVTTEPVIYRLADTYVSGGAMTCELAGPSGNAAVAYAGLIGELGNAAAGAAVPAEELALGAIGDFEFTSSNGGAAAAAAAIATRLNNVDGIFSSQVGVQITVPEIETHASASDPFSDTSTPDILLDELAAYRAATPAQLSQGLTHLFTGRNLDGSTVGLAYSAALCESFGAGLTEGTHGSTTDSLIAAHEIGHNFGAPHDGEPGACESESTSFLMAPTINTSDQFSPCSLVQMAPEIAAASCLRPLPGFDVTVVASGAPFGPLLGNSVTANFEVRNLGTDTASNAAVDIALPSNVTFVSAAAVPGSCSSGGGIVNCDIGTLATGASSAVIVSTIAAAVGSGSFDATVSADADDNPGNDAASIGFVVQPAVDLVISVPASPQLQLNRSTTISVPLENRSILDATGVTLIATVDSGLRVGSVSWSIGSCDVNGLRIDCNAATFANQSTSMLTFEVTGVIAGRQDYLLALSANELDRNDADNNVSGSVTVTTADSGGGGNGGSSDGGGASGGVFLIVLLWVLLCRRFAALQKLSADLRTSAH